MNTKGKPIISDDNKATNNNTSASTNDVCADIQNGECSKISGTSSTMSREPALCEISKAADLCDKCQQKLGCSSSNLALKQQQQQLEQCTKITCTSYAGAGNFREHQEQKTHRQMIPSIDIDEQDKYNSLHAAPYAQTIHDQLRVREGEYHQTSLEHEDICTRHPQLKEEDRTVLIDWLINVHIEYRLRTETLFSCISLLNSSISTADISITRHYFQLVGMVCLLICSTFEEKNKLKVSDLVYVCDSAYTGEEIIYVQVLMVSRYHFQINLPTSLPFLRRAIKAATSLNYIPKSGDKIELIRSLSRYLCELSWFHKNSFSFRPSMLAAAALRVAASTCGQSTGNWGPDMVYYTGWSVEKLVECEDMLKNVVIPEEVEVHGITSKLTALKKKFDDPKYHHISVKLPQILKSKEQ